MDLTILDIRWPLNFFPETDFIYNDLHVVQNEQKLSAGSEQKFKISVHGTSNPAIDLSTARCVRLWSLNSSLFSKEPRQLTHLMVHLKKIWQLTRPDFLDLGYFSGHILSKTKSVLPLWQKWIITFLRGKFKKVCVWERLGANFPKVLLTLVQLSISQKKNGGFLKTRLFYKSSEQTTIRFSTAKYTRLGTANYCSGRRLSSSVFLPIKDYTLRLRRLEVSARSQVLKLISSKSRPFPAIVRWRLIVFSNMLDFVLPLKLGQNLLASWKTKMLMSKMT